MLDASKVEELFTECLIKGADVGTETVRVDGIVHNADFSKDRLVEKQEAVAALLIQLPDEFMVTGGGGMSFLNMCMDRDGNQWGEHLQMEELYLMGKGLGLADFCLPRDMWTALPGGMPYIVVKL